MYLLLRADQRLKRNHEDVLLLAHLQELYVSVKDLGLIIEPGTYSPIAYPVSKRLSTLCYGDLPREEDGAIEFWRIKDYLRNVFENSRCWSDEMRKSRMAGGGGNEKIFQYCTDLSGQEILLSPSSSRSFRDAIPLIHHYRTMC